MCIYFKLHLKIKMYTFVASPCALCDQECILDYFKNAFILGSSGNFNPNRTESLINVSSCHDS